MFNKNSNERLKIFILKRPHRFYSNVGSTTTTQAWSPSLLQSIYHSARRVNARHSASVSLATRRKRLGIDFRRGAGIPREQGISISASPSTSTTTSATSRSPCFATEFDPSPIASSPINSINRALSDAGLIKHRQKLYFR